MVGLITKQKARQSKILIVKITVIVCTINCYIVYHYNSSKTACYELKLWTPWHPRKFICLCWIWTLGFGGDNNVQMRSWEWGPCDRINVLLWRVSLPDDSDSKESACNAGDPGYLEKEMATHSSILAGRIP